MPEVKDSSDEDLKLLQTTTDALMEHFDSVQIFVTRHESDGTTDASFGAGNWFARYGQVKDWVAAKDRQASEGGDDE